MRRFYDAARLFEHVDGAASKHPVFRKSVLVFGPMLEGGQGALSAKRKGPERVLRAF